MSMSFIQAALWASDMRRSRRVCAHAIRQGRALIRNVTADAIRSGKIKTDFADVYCRGWQSAGFAQLSRAAMAAYPDQMHARAQAGRKMTAVCLPQRMSSHQVRVSALDALAFSRSPLPGAPGCDGTYDLDDGYSMCGLADAHADERYYAFREAKRLAMVARVLKDNGC
jgi:hypothetical protein